MLEEDSQFSELMSKNFKNRNPDETIIIPKWILVTLCYALPGSWLLPLGTLSGEMVIPAIFTLILGTGIYFYASHVGIINAFVKQKKPLRDVLYEYKQQEQAKMTNAKDTAPDSLLNGGPTRLSDDEEQNWSQLLLQLSTTTEEPTTKKNRWRKKK